MNTDITLPPIVKSKDAMAFLGIERNTLNKLIKTKQLTRHKGFAGIRFCREDLLAFASNKK